MEPAGFNPHVLDEVVKEGELSSGVVITFQVMAVPGVSPGNPNTISTLAESGQDELGIHPPRAGYPDDPDVRGVLQSAYPGKICGAVRTPIAEEGNYLRLPVQVFYVGHTNSSFGGCQIHFGLLGM